MSEALAANTQLPGDHVVESRVAEGRVQDIYRVRAPDGATRAACVLHAELNDELGEWFLAAAALRLPLTHPSLPRTFVLGRAATGEPTEITELLEGKTLRALLGESPTGIEVVQVVHVITALAGALDHLHGRTPPVIHRAMTPDRVYLVEATSTVKLLGTGVADRPRFEAGHPAYQSPEELAGITELGPRADVFVLATLCFEMLTGRPAFSGTASEILDAMRVGRHDRVSLARPEVSPDIDVLLRETWSLTPDARPASAGKFAERLTRACAGLLRTIQDGAPVSSAFLDDKPTTEVPVLNFKRGRATLLDVGAAATASAQRDSSEPRSAPVTPFARPAARAAKLPAPPGTRPVVEQNKKRSGSGLAVRPPVDPSGEATDPSVRVPHDHVTPTAILSPPPPPEQTPEPVLPEDLLRETPVPAGGDDVDTDSTQAPAPDEAPKAVEPAREEPVRASRPPDPPVEAPVVEAPRASLPPPVVMPSPLPPPPPPVQVVAPVYAPQPSPPPPRPSPRSLLADEPTTQISLPPAEKPWYRTPVGLAGLFVAHAILIAGVAHAIAWSVVAQRPPERVVVTAPAPACAACVCAPTQCPACAACPVCAAVVAPVVDAGVRPRPAYTRPSQRPGLIQRMPQF